jgi:5-methylcytosine-specific restriction endonuclease McrA
MKVCKSCGSFSSPRWNGRECWECSKARVAKWKRENHDKPAYKNALAAQGKKIKERYATDPEYRAGRIAYAVERHKATYVPKPPRKPGIGRDPEKRKIAAKKWKSENVEIVREVARLGAKRRRAERKDAGICGYCREPLFKGGRCEKHYAEHRANDGHKPETSAAYRERWRVENREHHLAMSCIYAERRRALITRAPGNGITPGRWIAIKAAQNQQCFDCGEALPLTMGHLRPLFQGGEHDVANIVAQCRPCNSRQGRRLHPSLDAKPFGDD